MKTKASNHHPEIGEQLATTVLKYRWLTIIACFLLMFVAASGLPRITMSSDFRYFFGKENPQRLAFERLQNVYAKDDSVLIAITPNSGDVFNHETLTGLKALTHDAWQMPFSTRVDSITNFQHTEAFEDDLVVQDLVYDDLFTDSKPLTVDQLAKIKQIALDEPFLAGTLVAHDARVTAVNIRINMPGKSPQELPLVAKFTRDLADQFKKNYPNHQVHLSGLGMLNNAFNEAGVKDMSTLTPLMYLVIMVIMIIFLRKISAIIATFMVIFLSVFSAMGFAGWFGIPMTPPSFIAPTVIITLAIADSVHIIKSIIAFMQLGQSKQDAIVNAIKVNLQPVFLTSFTTAVGFLTLNFSDTPPFHDLGNITAMGVTVAFIFSITLLPAVISLLSFKIKVKAQNENTILDNFGHWVVSNKYPVFGITLAITVFLGMQIPKIVINDQFVKYFAKSIPFRTDTEYLVENLTGIYQINFDLNSGESQGITNPQYLNKVEDFANWYRQVPGVTHVTTMTDVFKRLNKNMHGDDVAYYKLPENRELAAQYLLLYEMSLPYGLDLNNRIDVDKQATRMVVTLADVDTTSIIDITKQGEQWLINNAHKHMATLGSSPTIMFSHITARNVASMFWGTLLAFAIISTVMVIALKSVKYGLISLLPNVFPMVMAFGVWSLLIGEAGFTVAVVCSVTLGIVVDDTVHFLTKYVRARKEGATTENAIRYSFTNVGAALLVTSAILLLGFSVLMLSTFKMNIHLGALSALTIGFALFTDFFFLPAFLALVDKGEYKQTNSKGQFNMQYNKVSSIIIGIVLTGWTTTATAEVRDIATAKDKGLAVAQNVNDAEDGFVNQVVEVKMVLKNKHGQQSSRQMRIKTLEVENDGDKSLTIFDTPKDVKGTVFLSYTHPLGPDDQWLFLPALKRIKKISSNNKSGPFMGSEFAYEDIASQEIEKYKYKYLREEAFEGIAGHVIERYPVDKKSGYTRQIMWADSKAWLVRKIDYYDRKDSILKTQLFSNYKLYNNGKSRAGKMVMENHQSGKNTTLIFSNYLFKQDLTSRDFDRNALKRIR